MADYDYPDKVNYTPQELKDRANTKTGNQTGNQPVTGYNQSIVQQALGFGRAGIQARQQAAQGSVDSIESGLFDQMGRMQLNTERDIAKRRMQALRQGMPSSQLAAMELQNIQTAQLGAQEVSREYDQLRTDMATEFAGQDDMLAHDMFEGIRQGRIDLEAIDAQKFATDFGAQMAEAFGEEQWDNLPMSAKLSMLQATTGIEIDKDAKKELDTLLAEGEDIPEGFWEKHGARMGAGAAAGGAAGLIGGPVGGAIGAGAGGVAGLVSSMFAEERKKNKK